MNAIEFLNEARKCEKCPSNFEEIYGEFRKHQQAALNTLKEFHRVCEKNNINYQLAYGSLLGAVRDNGQIPWDYDIDVFVEYADRLKLVEALKKDLNDRYYFYSPEVDSKCRHFFLRLAPNGYRTEILHVDVFYYIGIPDDDQERSRFISKVKKTSVARYYKMINPKEEATGDLIKELKILLHKVPYLFCNINKITKEYEELCEKYSVGSTEYCTSADVFADWYEFPSRIFKNTKLLDINTGKFRIPTEYDEMLTIVYKNYKKIPRIEERIHEVVYNYNRIKYFEK